jgi:hypothetical protein
MGGTHALKYFARKLKDGLAVLFDRDRAGISIQSLPKGVNVSWPFRREFSDLLLQ